MEAALQTIEANYPYGPGGVMTHVAYSDNYFARLPAALVSADMPRTVSFNGLPSGQPVLKRAGARPDRRRARQPALELRRAEFTVPVRMESNDILFTMRSDDSSRIADVVAWLSGSNRMLGRTQRVPRFDAGMTITSTRAMFVQMGLPRTSPPPRACRSPLRQPVLPDVDGLRRPAGQRQRAAAGGHLPRRQRHQADQRHGRQLLRQRLHPAPVARAAGPATVLRGRTRPRRGRRREPFSERLQYMFESPPQVAEDPNDPFRDGGGPRNHGPAGAFLPNVFPRRRLRQAERPAVRQNGAHLAVAPFRTHQRRPADPPAHRRPGFDSMDTTTGRNTPKLQFSGFFPSADFFSTLRRNQASVDLMDEFDLEEEDHGLERFLTATRRQNS
jgi:hypothetical protein